ncbi:hypothetical protein EVAR_77551_1 [Eumeta japonica]|uniref:Uncharacterized protein n=1 Tax=Eumeta variegata TaxID=151549 RepID=A0A4C1T7H1_EUMVA|nr:hypothetical protein EVAR_77551_1 [Eumeta japonica]
MEPIKGRPDGWTDDGDLVIGRRWHSLDGNGQDIAERVNRVNPGTVEGGKVNQRNAGKTPRESCRHRTDQRCKRQRWVEVYGSLVIDKCGQPVVNNKSRCPAAKCAQSAVGAISFGSFNTRRATAEGASAPLMQKQQRYIQASSPCEFRISTANFEVKQQTLITNGRFSRQSFDPDSVLRSILAPYREADVDLPSVANAPGSCTCHHELGSGDRLLLFDRHRRISCGSGELQFISDTLDMNLAYGNEGITGKPRVNFESCSEHIL